MVMIRVDTGWKRKFIDHVAFRLKGAVVVLEQLEKTNVLLFIKCLLRPVMRMARQTALLRRLDGRHVHGGTDAPRKPCT